MTTSVSALVLRLLLCYIMPVLGAICISTCIELFFFFLKKNWLRNKIFCRSTFKKQSPPPLEMFLFVVMSTYGILGLSYVLQSMGFPPSFVLWENYVVAH